MDNPDGSSNEPPTAEGAYWKTKAKPYLGDVMYHCCPGDGRILTFVEGALSMTQSRIASLYFRNLSGSRT